jgi:hypothetical protein
MKRSHLSRPFRRKEGVKNNKNKNKNKKTTTTTKAAKDKTLFGWRMNPGMLGREGSALLR